MNLHEWLSPPALRALQASALLLGYAGFCTGVWWRAQRRHAAASLPPPADARNPWLVVHASQTGQAEQLATQTARVLQAAGLPVWLRPLGELDGAALAGCERALFVIATTGEGDAPDGAARFLRRMIDAATPPALQDLRHAVLALGDRGYARYCGFGRQFDAWLQAHGARPLFDRVEVDRLDAGALTHWREALARSAGIDIGTVDAGPRADEPAAFGRWHLAGRSLLNPGSLGAPIWQLDFEPAEGAPLPDWQAGDLAQVQAPGDDGALRDYSIASVPADGRLQLIVRVAQRSDGTPGRVSGWLTAPETLGSTLALRPRTHPGFQLGANAGRPLILIGNGTGLAGLRAHLRARQHARAGSTPPRHWLLFGERQRAHDALCADEIASWQRSGLLERVDWVFSRDTPERRYVQHALAESAPTLRAWIDNGAAIYVCGGRDGMGTGVDTVLREVLGSAALDELAAAGRYRRDVY